MARAQTAVQLELPCTLDQATLLAEEVARLKDKLTEVHEDCAVLHAQMQALSDSVTFWHKENATAWAAVARLKRELSDVRQSSRDDFDSIMMESHARRSVLPPWLDAGLKALISEAHPDKWSAGQPSTELAHALTVELNALRARLGEVH